MVYLGTVNSRIKGFYDISLLAQQSDFDGADLGESIAKTFRNRATKLDPDPIALTEAFTRTEARVDNDKSRNGRPASEPGEEQNYGAQKEPRAS